MEICRCYLQIKDFLFLSLKSWLTSTLLLFVLNLYLKDFCQCPANPYQMSDIWDTTESGSVKVLVAQSCLPLRARMVCSPPGSSVCGTLQARILEWVAILFSRGSSWPKDWTQVSHTAGIFLTICATREAHCGHKMTIQKELEIDDFFTYAIIKRYLGDRALSLLYSPWAAL